VAQTEQSEELVPLNLPAAHSLHPVLLAPSAYLPAGHGTQTATLYVSVNQPATHGVQVI
jgi:hypothetical protein